MAYVGAQGRGGKTERYLIYKGRSSGGGGTQNHAVNHCKRGEAMAVKLENIEENEESGNVACGEGYNDTVGDEEFMCVLETDPTPVVHVKNDIEGSSAA